MSQEQNGQDITLPAVGDLSAAQYKAVVVNTSGQAAAAGADAVIAGILQNDPAAAGRGCTVRNFGSSKFVAGTGGVTAGDTLRSEAGGALVTASTGENRGALALETVAAGGIGECLLLPNGSAVSLGQSAYAEVLVSSAEILALNTTQKTIVAAPGAGYTIEFISAVLILDYVSAAYATNGALTFRETSDAGTALSDEVPLADFLDETADTMMTCQALSANIALTENAPLVLSCATGDPATGDSPVRVKCAYRIHATGL